MVGGGCAAGSVGRSDFLSVPLLPHDLVRRRVAPRAQYPCAGAVPAEGVSAEGEGRKGTRTKDMARGSHGGAKERGRGRRMEGQRDRAT